jgi:hypothetical protein
MDVELERRDEIAVRVQVRLSTMLVAVALLAPEQLEWAFDVEAGGAGARGSMRLELAAPRFYSTIYSEFEYTASGTWNSYRGLLWHWEATGLPPGRPMWIEAFGEEPRHPKKSSHRGHREERRLPQVQDPRTSVPLREGDGA